MNSFTLSHLISLFKTHFNIILRLPNGLFSLGFSFKLLRTAYVPMRATCVAHLTTSDLNTLVTLDEEYKL